MFDLLISGFNSVKFCRVKQTILIQQHMATENSNTKSSHDGEKNTLAGPNKETELKLRRETAPLKTLQNDNNG